VNPRVSLDTEVRGKYFRLCRGSNLDRPVVQPVATLLTELPDWLMLFKEIIAVYTENYTEPINTKCSVTDC
jgi:hypothetical protein